jgi:hypothetical protein
MTAQTEKTFQEVTQDLHAHLREHQAALMAEGLLEDLEGLLRWIRQVEAGKVSVHDATAGYGMKMLLHMRDRLKMALKEQQRAAEEFPVASPEADREQQKYRDAFLSVSKSLDAFLQTMDARSLSDVTTTVH